MQYKSFAITRAVLTAFILGASAQATILNEYTNFTAWSAATGVATPQQTFSGLGSPFNGTNSGLSLAGPITYLGFYNESTPTPGYFTYLNGVPPSGDDIGSGAYMLGGINGVPGSGVTPFDTGIRATLSSLPGINAFSFNYSAWREPQIGSRIYSTSGTPINLTLEVYEGAAVSIKSLVVPAGSPVAGFFGFTTSGSISSVKLLISSPTNTIWNLVALDNVAYATIAASGGGGETGGGGDIPEPQTYLLCAAGLFGAALLRRKKN